MIKTICFICTGNTCRSPMAEGIFREMLSEKGIGGITVISRGIGVYSNEPVAQAAVKAASVYGADISSHKPTQLNKSDITEDTVFVCMTAQHRDALENLVPNNQLYVLGKGIPDPYMGGEDIYRACADLISIQLKELLTVLNLNHVTNLKNVSLENVDITGGFWFDKQCLNRTVTIDSVRKQFENTGRMDAFKCNWHDGMPNKPHIFYDSDVAKWMESAAYILQKNPDTELESYVEYLIDLIEKNQGADGYFNIYFTVCEPEERWHNRMAHELYCAGHLMEAAVAYVTATGKDRFLKLMCKYADYIEKVFKIDRTAEFSTPGHEEIELALVKLYHATNETRYLELAKFFIDVRGTKAAKEFENDETMPYMQDHMPVREQTDAVGHCVRAAYLYCGMADVANEYNDSELLSACKALFNSIYLKRMYITGATGSTNNGEKFTVDYDLPNSTAYAETCAAISNAMFASRMAKYDINSCYADLAERVMYNGMLSGISLDGKSFFYENPLEINLRDREPERDHWHKPITQRVEVFGCSCCPPNVTRFIASIGENIYAYNDDIIYVNHFIQSSANVDIGEKKVLLTQTTDYPRDGRVTLTIQGFNGKKIAIRLPCWCKSYTLKNNLGNNFNAHDDGYIYVTCDDETTITFDMNITPFWVESNPHVWANEGKVALQRGPVIYCTEGIDNVEELWKLRVDTADVPVEEFDDNLNQITLISNGYEKNDTEELYRTYNDTYKNVKIKFIPYYAFANRGESNMRVWMQKK